MYSKTKDSIRESQYSSKNEVRFVNTLFRRIFFGIQQSPVDQKTATM